MHLRSLVLLFAAMLASCGGGGGQNSSSTAGSTAAQRASPWKTAEPFGLLSGGLPFGASVAVDEAGTALFFQSRMESSTEVAARVYRRSVDRAWNDDAVPGPPTPVIAFGPTAPLRQYESPQIVVDGAGNALAIFTLRDSSDWDRKWTSRVFVARREAVSGTWNVVRALEASADGYARDGRLVLEPGGTAWAVWTERTFKDVEFQTRDRYAIFAARFTPASGWSPPEKISSDVPWRVTARVTTDKRGNPRAIIAWNSGDPLQSTLYYTARSPSGAWSALQELSVAVPAGSHAPNFDEYDLAVDAQDNAIALWRQYDGERYVVLVRRFTASGGWTDVGRLSRLDLDSAFEPQLAMDANGDAFALWRQSDGVTSYTIFAARYERAQGWTTPERIAARPVLRGDDAESPRIGFDALGNAVAIWKMYDGVVNHTVIRANVYARGKGWLGDETISGPLDETTWMPDLAVSASGHAIAVWWQMDNGNLFRPWSAFRPASAGF